jgi:hypothetical protein
MYNNSEGEITIARTATSVRFFESDLSFLDRAGLGSVRIIARNKVHEFVAQMRDHGVYRSILPNQNERGGAVGREVARGVQVHCAATRAMHQDPCGIQANIEWSDETAFIL